jgi:hypothetical protein
VICNLSFHFEDKENHTLSLPSRPLFVVSPQFVVAAPSSVLSETLNTVVGEFFRQLLSRPLTRPAIKAILGQNPTLALQPAVNLTLSPASIQALISTPFSLEDLVYLLTQSIQGLNATITSLSTLVSIVISALSWQNSSSHSLVVEKPTSFEDKDSESAWLFHSAFHIWVESNKRFYQHWLNSTCIIHQDREELLDKFKMITLALLFMTKDAVVWAYPYLE